jgi:hypothetical protein
MSARAAASSQIASASVDGGESEGDGGAADEGEVPEEEEEEEDDDDDSTVDRDMERFGSDPAVSATSSLPLLFPAANACSHADELAAAVLRAAAVDASRPTPPGVPARGRRAVTCRSSRGGW